MPTLAGARIWLSASIPRPGDVPEWERASIARFVARFAKNVFHNGGHIVHGSHPSIVPILLEAAMAFRGSRRSDCLTLVSSRYFSQNRSPESLEFVRRESLYYETEHVPGDLVKSLQILREWIASRSDAVVAVGGQWWNKQSNGVPDELALASERHIPCFLVGGLGGAAARHLENHPGVLGELRNGFDPNTNRVLAQATDVSEVTDKICAQLAELPLVRGRGTDGVAFRILALDGGGIKGTFTAAALATWERLTNLRIVDHFDLIAGTSTGGILAVGLGLGLTAEELLEFYKKRGPTIFPMTSMRRRFWHGLRHWWRPKFAQEVLHKELQSAYYRSPAGLPVTLGQSQCRLLIPSYHATAGGTHVFRTPHHSLLNSNGNMPAADAALATAAAPSYFSAAQVKELLTEASYFDGGVWANSPAMAAVIEATCYLGVPLDRLDVLSVGTTDEPFSVIGKRRAGVLGWASNKTILRLLMNAQEDASLKYAKLLAGSSRFLRVNFTTKPDQYRLDGTKNISQLASLGQVKAQDPDLLSEVRSRFLNGVSAAPWQSY